MQRCTDCGHSNRSGVHYCTHCGNPVVASGASLGGPTTVVAAAVLAIGLLAFLTIRPVSSTLSPAETFPSPPPSALHETVADDDAGPLPAAPVELIAVQDEAAVPAPGLDPTRAPGLEPSHTPGLDASHTPGLDASRTPGLDLSLTPGLDPSLVSVDLLETPSSELMMPASSSPASSLVLQAAPALAGPVRALDAADAEQSSLRAPVRSPERAHSHGQANAASSSTGKRAAVEGARTRRDVAPERAKARESWRASLRAEIEACGGNFIVRTVCVERAKMQHCGSARAWGDVPECPAAQPPELATFN